MGPRRNEWDRGLRHPGAVSVAAGVQTAPVSYTLSSRTDLKRGYSGITLFLPPNKDSGKLLREDSPVKRSYWSMDEASGVYQCVSPS